MAGVTAMRQHRKIYRGVSLDRRDDEVHKVLEGRETHTDIYVISQAVNREDQLDIRRADDFIRRFGDDTDSPCIVGLAGDREEALALLRVMAEDCVAQTGKADLRSYFGFDSE